MAVFLWKKPSKFWQNFILDYNLYVILYYFLFFNFVRMSVETLKNGADWMDEEVKKPLKALKNEVVKSKENIPVGVIKKHLDYYNQLLKGQLAAPFLTSKQKGIIRKISKRFIDDVKNHPNAYFMPVKEIQKLWVTYSTLDRKDHYGFIHNNKLSKSLWATFKVTREEEAFINQNDIFFRDDI